MSFSTTDLDLHVEVASLEAIQVILLLPMCMTVTQARMLIGGRGSRKAMIVDLRRRGTDYGDGAQRLIRRGGGGGDTTRIMIVK